jgi:hypothetical protein
MKEHRHEKAPLVVKGKALYWYVMVHLIIQKFKIMPLCMMKPPVPGSTPGTGFPGM